MDYIISIDDSPFSGTDHATQCLVAALNAQGWRYNAETGNFSPPKLQRGYAVELAYARQSGTVAGTFVGDSGMRRRCIAAGLLALEDGKAELTPRGHALCVAFANGLPHDSLAETD